jgi:hypothetical protein
MFLGAGWDKLERQEGTPYRWRWIGASADIRLYNPFDRPVIATVALTASSYQDARTLQLDLDQAPFGQLAAQPDRPSTKRFLFLLQPGEHVLTLSAPATTDPGRAGRNVSVRMYQIAAHFDELAQF